MGEKTEARSARPAFFGHVARGARDVGAALGEKLFDDAILERMKGDHDQAAAGCERAFRSVEAASEFAELVIHMDAEGLKRSGGWMDGKAGGFCSLCRRHDLGQLQRRRQRACRNDGAGDTARIALFAQARNDLDQIFFVGRIGEVGGASTFAAHAHVERTFGTKRKAALRLVELERGSAEIEHDAVGARAGEQHIELRELAPHEREAAAELRHQILAARDGVGIAIDAEHAAIGGFENGAGIAAAAEGAVDIMLAVLGREQREHFVQHHGKMAAHVSPRESLAISRSRLALMRAMRSASTAAKRSLSQIWNFCDMPTKTIFSVRPAWAIIASGTRTRPGSSVGSNCVREIIA